MFETWVERKTAKMRMFIRIDSYNFPHGTIEKSYGVQDARGVGQSYDGSPVSIEENDILIEEYRRSNHVISPFALHIKILNDDQQWLNGLCRNDEESTRILQDEIDSVYREDAKEAVKIYDHKSYMRSPSRYIFPIIMNSRELCLRYGIDNFHDLWSGLDYAIEIFPISYSGSLIALLGRNPNMDYYFIKQSGKMLLACDWYRDGKVIRKSNTYDINRTIFEKLSKWGIPVRN